MAIRTAQQNNARQFLLVSALVLIGFFIAQFGSRQSLAVRSVSTLEAKHLIDAGALVIDVRGPDSFAGRHIPGAVSIPLETLKIAIPAAIAQSKAKPIVVYCGDGVSIGPEGTAVLNKAGFTNAVNLGPGISGWADAGYPIVKSGAGA